jgi:uncharacterized membrane protein YkvA (DUF1232 family)
LNEQEHAPSEEEAMEPAENALETVEHTDESFWREFLNQVRLVWYLLRDPEVPWYLKLLPAAGFIYFLIPTDLLPDLFPVLGQVDDLAILMASSKVFIELSPPQLVAHYLRLMRQRRTADNLAGVEPSDKEIQNAIIIEGEYDAVENGEGDS